LIYGQNSFSKLDGMSALDMINYDCSNKNNKISIAVIEDGIITFHIYGSEGSETAIRTQTIQKASEILSSCKINKTRGSIRTHLSVLF